MDDAILGKLAAGQDLTMVEMEAAIDSVMSGEVSNERIALLLTGLRAKGETVDELAGAARALRRHMTPVACRRDHLVDTCGTGGDGAGVFNISTAAAIVAAASGARVAKHGNRKVTSKSGSADVLVELGVNIDAPVDTVARCLDEFGIGFFYAPRWHPAMRRVAEVRRSLGVRTIFNLLGPLSNPAQAPYQLLGVGKSELRPLLAEALQRLSVRRAVVVTGDDGLDEITLATDTRVSLMRTGAALEEQTWRPEDFGLSKAPLDSMKADTPQASAALIRGVLRGDRGPARDIVVLNAAAALWCAELAEDLETAAQRTIHAIDSGAAQHKLQQLVEGARAA